MTETTASGALAVDIGRLSAELARRGHHAFDRCKPLLREWLEAPSDLVIKSMSGALYSGVALFDENEIVAAMVAKVQNGDHHERPLVTPPPHQHPYPYTSSWGGGDDRDEEDDGWMRG